MTTAPSQLTLFDRVDHGLESRNDAFASVSPSLNERRQRVLDAFTAAGQQGVTIDELAEQFAVAPNVISGRCTELKRSGLIIATAARRPTRSGHSAAVLVALHNPSAIEVTP